MGYNFKHILLRKCFFMNKKKQYGMTKAQEAEAARLLGRPVTPAKAAVSAAVSSLTCLLPILMGLRLWPQIPEVVQTGLTTASGQDDSMPRAVLVYGLPLLWFVLNAICHGQLFLAQKRKKLANRPVRICGRWSFPVISVLFCGWSASSAAGQPVGSAYYLPAAVALLVLLGGARLFDCRKDDFMALPFPFLDRSEEWRRRAHRLAALCWMISGLLLLTSLTAFGQLKGWCLTIALLLLILPFGLIWLYGRKR